MPRTVSVEDTIARWHPQSVPDAVVSFARAAVTSCGPARTARAKDLLFACSKLGAFGHGVGLELSAPVLLHPSVIERFIVTTERTLSPPTRRTLRSNLRYVAARALEHPPPAPVALPRERASAPYSESQIAAYLALCEAQPTLSRRRRGTGLVCLGAGAGLMGAELRHVRGTDVAVRSGGVVVDVTGPRERVVPVLARYHDALLASALFARDGYVIGGTEGTRRNVTAPLTRSLAGGVGLARLSTGRLRATWLTSCAEALGLKTFMAAAGIVCSQRLGDLIAHLDAVDEERAVVLLGGRR
jgi:integrase